MRVDDFAFDLPEERIALRPVEPRDAARLLIVRPGAEPEDRIVRDLPQVLRSGDVLVFNNTKVIPTQLQGVRARGGAEVAISATLIERIDGSDWWALAKPGRKLAVGDRLRFTAEPSAARPVTLEATVEHKEPDGRIRVAFDVHGEALDAALHSIGAPPLPPYIAARRPADDRDRDDYQTIYAEHEGAVAAPTAGLHFTPDLIARLDAQGIGHVFLTLHVGPGTFLPVKVTDVDDHRMHAERGVITTAVAERLNRARAAGGRIVAVGTTAIRLLESAVDEAGRIHAFDGETDIFITPGYRFHAVDLLMTNFHLPRSTLFMLVSAFSGLDMMKAAYRHAVAAGYRFYSYGDACLLSPEPRP